MPSVKSSDTESSAVGVPAKAGPRRADGPVVADVGESVTKAVERVGRLWTSRARATAVACTGAAWLVVTIVVAAVWPGRAPAADPLLLSGLGVAAAILSAALARAARRRSWRLPGWLRAVLAASAIPELAIAGVVAGGSHHAPAQLALDATAGAVCGALLALAACPGAITAGLLALALLGVVVAGGLGAAWADLTQSAGVVAVATLWLYGLAPAAIAWLVTGASPRKGLGGVAVGVSEQVRRAQLLVTVWQSVLAVAAALALCWLAASAQASALALAGCVALALPLTASGYRQLGSVLPGVAGGAVGLLAVGLLVPERLGAPSWAGAVACCVVGVVLLLTGVAWSRSGPEETVPGPAAWRGPLAGLLQVVPVPLLAGLFGAFGHLVTVGRGL